MEFLSLSLINRTSILNLQKNVSIVLNLMLIEARSNVASYKGENRENALIYRLPTKESS